MNLKTMIDAATALAHQAAQVIPQAGLAEDGLKIVGNIEDLIVNFKKISPDVQSTAQLEQAHSDLLKHVGEKGALLSDRLRGK